MRNVKKWIATVLTLAMVLAIALTTTAFASVSDTGYTDVDADDWCTEAVRWEASEQIMGGYGNGLFGTNDPVSREQIATILWRYEGSPEAGASAGFADDADISDYAASAAAWARDNGVINGMPGNRFAPQNSATRAEVATILMNYTRKDQPAPNPEPTPSPRPPRCPRWKSGCLASAWPPAPFCPPLPAVSHRC